MSERVSITVDGREATVRPGAMLLDALREAGSEVPTLCHHPSVEPSGACRLCSVEVSHADWGGWSGLVTSCLYPVEPGLVVSTRSDRVARTRRTLLELYMARCPDSPEIAALARAEGIDCTAFAPRADADLCIQCGLCVRVCQDLSTAAIAPLGRGTEKGVGPRPDGLAEDCVGCQACAHVCPTGEITSTMEGGVLRIWQREFPLPICAVTPEHCRACGLCEEVCPTDIPRIAPRVDGTLAATISAEACEGCGICAGSCPTGAITQPGFEQGELAPRAPGKGIVYACARSDFGEDLPEGVELVRVPCVGRVGPEHLVEAMAAGADGALLMCRDRESCPHSVGGIYSEERAVVTSELLALAGLGEGRVDYLRPEPGLGGPARGAADWREGLAPTPLDDPLEGAGAPGGLDRALELLRALRMRPELAEASDDYREHTLLDWGSTRGDLPELALLSEPLGGGAGTGLVQAIKAGACDGDGFRFRITQEERRGLAARLSSDPEGAICHEPCDYLQLALLAREGAWQQGACAPPRFQPEEVTS